MKVDFIYLLNLLNFLLLWYRYLLDLLGLTLLVRGFSKEIRQNITNMNCRSGWVNIYGRSLNTRSSTNIQLRILRLLLNLYHFDDRNLSFDLLLFWFYVDNNRFRLGGSWSRRSRLGFTGLIQRSSWTVVHLFIDLFGRVNFLFAMLAQLESEADSVLLDLVLKVSFYLVSQILNIMRLTDL